MAQTALFTFDDETMRHLRFLAEDGKRSEFVRNLINREYNRVFGDGEVAHAPMPEPVNPFVAEMD